MKPGGSGIGFWYKTIKKRGTDIGTSSFLQTPLIFYLFR